MQTMLRSASVFCLFLLGTLKTLAVNTDTLVCPYDCCRPDGHAPLGIMTDHVHSRHEWGFSYSYTNIQFNGNQQGTSGLSDNQVYTNYMMAPDKMTMQMHMFMAMYGITNKLSVMAMFGYASNYMSMNMISPVVMDMPGMNSGVNPGGQMINRSSGFTDTRIHALFKVYDQNRKRLIVSLGLSAPTGTTRATGITMLGEGQRLPYLMQLGSGTWDLLPAVAFTGQRDLLSWGIQAEGNIRNGSNTQGYSLGNEYRGNVWFSWRFCKWMSASLRAEEIITEKIAGYDPYISILMNNDPSSDVVNSGGQKTSLFLGLNLYKPKMPCRNNRLMLEYGIPVYQQVNGIQMPVTHTFLAGWQYNF